MTPISTSFSQQRRFRGLDLFHAPENLDNGDVQQADNLYVDGGELVTRPGKSGQFTAPLGAALYSPIAFVKAGGGREILFVSGGNLYTTTKGAPTYSKIRINGVTDFSLTGPATQMARVGKYVYVIDGQATTPLYRVDLDAATTDTIATVATTPGAPTAPLAAILINNTIDNFASAAGWSSRSAPSPTTELVLNGGFELPGTHDPMYADHWTSLGVADPDCYSGMGAASYMRPFEGSFVLLLDDPGEGVFQDMTAPTYGGGLMGSARVYAFEGYFHQADPTGASTVIVTLYGLDGSGNILGQTSEELTFPYNPDTTATGWVRARVTFSLTSLPVDPASVRLELRGGEKNKRGYQAPYIDAVSLKAVRNPLLISQGANSFTLSALDVYQGEDYIVKSYAAPMDFSGSNVVALAYSSPSPTARPALRLVLHKHLDPASTFYPSNLLNFSADGTFASVDLTTIPLDVRQSVDALYIQIASDMAGADPNNLFTIGPLTAAGNLAISDGVSVSAGPYQYVFTEVESTPGGDIESDPSPISNAVAATGLKAIAAMTLPAPANGSATTYFQIYRYGGLYGDAVGRLVARVPVAAGADITAYDSAHYYLWTSANRKFTDDTPDGALLLAPTLINGRGKPPTGAQALCEWQGRLWLAVGSTLWGSWLITGDTPGALYYNAVSYPDDPSASIKGFRVSVGGLDNDPIQQLIPLSSALIILKQRSVWMLTGFDSSDFQLSGHYLKAGVGCIAPRAAALVEGRLWFLGPNGLYEFDGGDEIAPRSAPIERALNPAQSSGSAILPAAYAGSALVYHGRRLYLFAPLPGGSANTAAYVWDSRQDGWTRYLQMNVTGAASLSTGADTDDLFLAGADGQLYELTGEGDRASPTAPAAPVAFAFASRGFGREESGDAYWRANRPARVFASVQTQDTATLTLGVNCSACDASMSQAYTVLGAASFRLKVPNGVRGLVTTVTLAGATVTPVRITSVAVESAEGGVHG
ncbi:hypothetical protein CCAX7_53840 [Capsulimonas corticalis]|uniref:Uncharacterized protein n=1 Tax=Capsulimonas corticalis TaxID=2219043 RepID=A0A402CNI0_9BACT|nr:hypothetical protein [Capsulimonas corticalis]BDI33333.1 hypothetical protein CCAX7_53840 [Capsulimonas corticalis]